MRHLSEVTRQMAKGQTLKLLLPIKHVTLTIECLSHLFINHVSMDNIPSKEIQAGGEAMIDRVLISRCCNVKEPSEQNEATSL